MWQSSNTTRIGQDAAYSAPLPGGQYATGQGFILVYRLGEDGELLQVRCGYASVLGVKSSLL